MFKVLNIKQFDKEIQLLRIVENDVVPKQSIILSLWASLNLHIFYVNFKRTQVGHNWFGKLNKHGRKEIEGNLKYYFLRFDIIYSSPTWWVDLIVEIETSILQKIYRMCTKLFYFFLQVTVLNSILLFRIC